MANGLAVDLDDEDLPDAAPAVPTSATPPPKDPASGRFVSPRQPAAPQHDPYLLHRASRHGVDAASMSPAELSRLLQALDAQEERLARREPPKVEKVEEPKEEPIDWGVNDEGKPFTEKDYTPQIARAIRAAHTVEKLQKKSEALEAALEHERQERTHSQALRTLNRKLATRSDLFGERPGIAPKESVEAERYQAIVSYLKSIPPDRRGESFEADVDKAMLLFGAAAPVKGKAGKPAPVDVYRDGEIARTTQRRAANSTSRREALIEEVKAERQENGAYFTSTPDDDDDLPD